MSTTTMLRCVTSIFFIQNSTDRNLKFGFDFVNQFSCGENWENLTNKGKIIIPKNVYVTDENGNKFPLGGTSPNKFIENLFRRGDKVSMLYGYYMYENGNENLQVLNIFDGYVSEVSSKIPIEIEIQDNMYLLKQIPCKPQVWPKTKTVEDLFRSLLSGTDFTVNALTSTTVGDLIIGNETVAQLLERLRKDFHFEAYFKRRELRIGSVVYIESEAIRNDFGFQQNIIKDELVYKRKDDTKLSAVVNSINTVISTKHNKAGHPKTKKERISVLVYQDSAGNFKYIEKKKGVDFPANVEGERRTLFYPNVNSAKELAQKGIDELKKYYYTGFRGKFTTFAYPFVKMGDNVYLKDEKLPDRNGLYRVRGVDRTGGIDGHRQIITLDFKLAS